MGVNLEASPEKSAGCIAGTTTYSASPDAFLAIFSLGYVTSVPIVFEFQSRGRIDLFVPSEAFSSFDSNVRADYIFVLWI